MLEKHKYVQDPKESVGLNGDSILPSIATRTLFLHIGYYLIYFHTTFTVIKKPPRRTRSEYFSLKCVFDSVLLKWQPFSSWGFTVTVNSRIIGFFPLLPYSPHQVNSHNSDEWQRRDNIFKFGLFVCLLVQQRLMNTECI